MSDDWGALCDAQEAALTSKVDTLNITGSTSSSSAVKQTPPPPQAGAAAAPQSVSPQHVLNATPQTVSNGAGDAVSATSTSPEPSTDNPVSKEEESLLRKILRSKLVTTKADLEVLRKDPNSPLFSVKSFEALNLKKELLKGLYDMGFNAPSKIQETALPSLLADPPVNMIAQSQSGTGKTAAFVLTMLSRVDTSKNYPQCLCLAPTYELALQIGQVTEQMAKHMTDLQIKYAVKGNRIERGKKIAEQIIIGTPGTLMDWAIKYKFFDLRKIKVFVLDEADVMIATQGHQDQSLRIQKELSGACQMLLFSATYDGDVMKFAQDVIPNDPITIRLRREEESLDNIRQYYIECSNMEEKYVALSNIYGTISIGQSMVFCHTRRAAGWLAEKMSKDGHVVGLLTGDLAVEQRAAIIKRFRSGTEKVLITTNVSARGIDVEMVTVVVNFDLPQLPDSKPDCETYLHRIGRTGRFGKSGIAINFVDGPKSMNNLRYIEKHFGRKILKLDAEDMESIEKIGT